MNRLPTYEFCDRARNTGLSCGSFARSFWSHPAFNLVPHAGPAILAACGELAERSFSRMASRPEWGIDCVTSDAGSFRVSRELLLRKPFGDLVGFKVAGRAPRARRILLIAPMSGHYATLVRRTVVNLLPDCEVFVTEWQNARDVPMSKGKFDIEDFTRYLVEFMQLLGGNTHVLAICQPAPLALAATAELAATDPASQPRSLILMGGPVVPDAAPTGVTEFGKQVTLGQLENLMVQQVGSRYAGAGRKVYPGALQLASFMSMNPGLHYAAFLGQMVRIARGLAADNDRHNRFYDEYQAVMDLPAEFFISTVTRLFKNSEIARNRFTLAGKPVDIERISATAVMTVEGGRDDISAPGQCSAILPMLTGIADHMKSSHVEADAGHYGIFSGRIWQEKIRPAVLNFVDARMPDAEI